MGHGYTTSHDVGVGASPAAAVAVVEAVRDVLDRLASAPLTATELRAGLRPLVRRARESGATIEQLLVVLKREWAALPRLRAMRVDRVDRGELTRRLERAVTLAIESYYEG